MATCISSATLKSATLVEKTTKRETELRLIQRAQRGDEEAFATLFQLHNRRVYAICLRMTKDASEAEDLMQDSFMQVFRNLTRFRGDSAFSTWLHRVAVNTVLMKFRQRKKPMISLDEPLSPDLPSLRREYGKTDPNLSGAIDRISIRRAMLELPPGCRRIFGLHAVHGYRHYEIAKLLHCSIGNSKSQLHKAKTKMRDLLFPKRGIRRLDATRIADQTAIVAAVNNSRAASALSTPAA